MNLRELAGQRATAVLLGLAGAGIGIVASSRSVISGTSMHAGLGTRSTFVLAGTTAVPAYPALLLAAAAGTMIWAFARPVLCRVVAAMVGTAGLSAGVAWRWGIVQASQSQTLPGGHVVQDISVLRWSFAGDLAALTIFISATLVLCMTTQWPMPGAERSVPESKSTQASAGPARTTSDQWDRMSRGEDPTV
ncbi:Trp biosynthesis-associated membrane protein [Austwickia chelonae]|uniref:Trp biosynthesis-associated membrane protein n=1 Tax=Austwickia chelonae TaxID=100225 RepID=UPI000E284FF1|nr:Trp biosynthesis-associated membrane protein [Austwickia chelonae]